MPDPFEQFQLSQIDHQLQNCLASVLHDPARNLHHFPSKGTDRLFHPRLRTPEPFEPNKKIVGNDPDPKENSIGNSAHKAYLLPQAGAPSQSHSSPLYQSSLPAPSDYATPILHVYFSPPPTSSSLQHDKNIAPFPSNKSLCLRISRFTTRRNASFVPFMQ